MPCGSMSWCLLNQMPASFFNRPSFNFHRASLHVSSINKTFIYEIFNFRQKHQIKKRESRLFDGCIIRFDVQENGKLLMIYILQYEVSHILN